VKFGHNDQKKDKNISDQKFQSNLEAMIKNVRDAGGTAVCSLRTKVAIRTNLSRL
jgi:hypothetical protein